MIVKKEVVNMSVKSKIIDETYKDLVYIFGSERKLKETMLRYYVHGLLFIVNVPEIQIEAANTTADLCGLWLDHRRNLQPNEPGQSSNEEYFDRAQDLEETELVTK